MLGESFLDKCTNHKALFLSNSSIVF